MAAVLVAFAAGGGAGGRNRGEVGFDPQDQGTDDLGAVPRSDYDVLGAGYPSVSSAIVLDQKPVPVQRLGGADVARHGVADGDEVRHDDARGQHHDGAGVVPTGGVGELVDEGEGGEEDA